MMGNPLFLALDVSSPGRDLDQAAELARRISPHVGGIKLGMEFFYGFGAEGYRRIAQLGLPILLDLKLHDIPATVATGVRSLTALRPAMITVHAGGGVAMMQAALAAAREAESPPRIVAVGLLTSLEEADLAREGIAQTAAERTARLGASAIAAGVDALVCSPLEVAALRAQWGGGVLLVTPGIRPPGARPDDQKRTLSPRQAVERGADILVIGRPILHACDPAASAEEIRGSLGAAPASGRREACTDTGHGHPG